MERVAERREQKTTRPPRCPTKSTVATPWRHGAVEEQLLRSRGVICAVSQQVQVFRGFNKFQRPQKRVRNFETTKKFFRSRKIFGPSTPSLSGSNSSGKRCLPLASQPTTMRRLESSAQLPTRKSRKRKSFPGSVGDWFQKFSPSCCWRLDARTQPPLDVHDWISGGWWPNRRSWWNWIIYIIFHGAGGVFQVLLRIKHVLKFQCYRTLLGDVGDWCLVLWLLPMGLLLNSCTTVYYWPTPG